MFRTPNVTPLCLVLLASTAALADTPRDPKPAASTTSAPPSGVREVIVARSRVWLGDLVTGLPATAAHLDAGAAPPAQGARLVTREEILELLRANRLTVNTGIPLTTRVMRKVRVLRDSELEVLLREAADRLPLRTGVTLSTVRAPRSLSVAEGWTKVGVEIPKLPRREGNVSSIAILVFTSEANVGPGATTGTTGTTGAPVESESLARVQIPVTFTLGPAAAVPALNHRSTVNLLVRRGLVEISTAALAGADADVGELFPVTVKATGKTLLARLLSSDRALAVETP